MTAALRGIRVLDLTGIATYFRVLTNRKPAHRRGKVQLVDATQWCQSLDGNGRIGRLLITLMLCTQACCASRSCTSSSTEAITMTC